MCHAEREYGRSCLQKLIFILAAVSFHLTGDENLALFDSLLSLSKKNLIISFVSFKYKALKPIILRAVKLKLCRVSLSILSEGPVLFHLRQCSPFHPLFNWIISH